MSRNYVLLLCILSAGWASCSGGPVAERAKPRPSILLVTIDTLRADHVGCYGSADAETPNLDRLAAEGVRFDDARSHVPLTAPSHATILTGVLPPRHGVRGNGSSHLAADAPDLAVALREGGYRTAAVVASVVLDRSTGLNRAPRFCHDWPMIHATCRRSLSGRRAAVTAQPAACPDHRAIAVSVYGRAGVFVA